VGCVADTTQKPSETPGPLCSAWPPHRCAEPSAGQRRFCWWVQPCGRLGRGRLTRTQRYAWQESGEVFQAFPLPGFCRLLCLSVFPAREFSERFAAAACSGWPQRPPSPGFRWWDHLGVFSVVVVTPEVPVGEGGSPNFQGEGGNGGCGKLCTVPCLSLPAEPTAEETCRVQGSCPSTQLPPLPTASRGLEESGSFTEEGAKPRGDGFHSFHRSSKGSRRIMSPSEL